MKRCASKTSKGWSSMTGLRQTSLLTLVTHFVFSKRKQINVGKRRGAKVSRHHLMLEGSTLDSLPFANCPRPPTGEHQNLSAHYHLTCKNQITSPLLQAPRERTSHEFVLHDMFRHCSAVSGLEVRERSGRWACSYHYLTKQSLQEYLPYPP